MRISSSDVNLSSTESFQRTSFFAENLNYWTDENPTGGLPSGKNTNLPAYLVDLSDTGKTLSSTQSVSQEPFRFELSEKDKRLIALLEAFFERLTGKKHHLHVLRETEASQASSTSSSINGSSDGFSLQPRAGWGLTYERHQSLQESQSFTFNGTGKVVTADGRSIDFSVSLQASRSLVEENHLSLKAGDALKDPLVINYGAASASLASTKVKLDIDNDGDEEQISNLAKGSGFLAFDKNEDGVINNGSELFGPDSGNGFQDLAAYDSDGNQWIDENDPIFRKLRIWTVDESGNSQLLALGQQGVGAIYLGNVSTQMDLMKGTSLDGKIQRSGVFLNENGSVGTVQHVDLKV